MAIETLAARTGATPLRIRRVQKICHRNFRFTDFLRHILSI